MVKVLFPVMLKSVPSSPETVTIRFPVPMFEMASVFVTFFPDSISNSSLSVGRDISGPNDFSYYVGYQLTFGP